MIVQVPVMFVQSPNFIFRCTRTDSLFGQTSFFPHPLSIFIDLDSESSMVHPISRIACLIYQNSLLCSFLMQSPPAVSGFCTRSAISSPIVLSLTFKPVMRTKHVLHSTSGRFARSILSLSVLLYNHLLWTSLSGRLKRHHDPAPHVLSGEFAATKFCCMSHV
jgi:hypothetical protein